MLALLPYPHTIWVGAAVGLSFSGIIPVIIFLSGHLFADENGSTMVSSSLHDLLSLLQIVAAFCFILASLLKFLLQICTAGVLFCANMGAALFPQLAGIIAEVASIRKGMWVGVGCVACMTVVASLLPRILRK